MGTLNHDPLISRDHFKFFNTLTLMGTISRENLLGIKYKSECLTEHHAKIITKRNIYGSKFYAKKILLQPQ